MTATSSSHLTLSSSSSLQKLKNHDYSIRQLQQNFHNSDIVSETISKVSQFPYPVFQENSSTSPSYLSLTEVYSHCTDEPDQINSIRMNPKVLEANQNHWIAVAYQKIGGLVFSNRGLNVCSVYWWRSEVLPTPELPRARNLIR